MTINQLPTLASQDGTVEFPVVYNGVDYKMPLGNMLLVKEVTGTTNTSGNVALGLIQHHVVLAVFRTGSNGLCTPFFNVTTGEWNAHITSPGASPSAVTSTSVTVLVFYVPCEFSYL